ncbi:MAG TPA: sulfite exporter TauE/SafE family protein [Burkholderiales bacterium]|jgi:sulfite exporter TauE/SafE|nr:sulfite exporter TauE/SafE family protein [Burkholderiales bacterium]
MPQATLFAVFLAGLLGGGHCMAMCGGVLGLLSGSPRAGIRLQLGYNLGRIGSYAVAGAVAGAAGGLVLARDILPLQVALYVAANLVLLAIGAYLLGWHAFVTRLEAPGRWLWARVSPLTRTLLPADTPGRALAAGLVWGWLPCGLVYSMLTLALLSGGAAAGAGLMAAFGLGTLPNLLLAGTLMRRVRPWLGRPLLRKVAGGLVLAAAVGGLAHASEVAGHLRRGLLCVV